MSKLVSMRLKEMQADIDVNVESQMQNHFYLGKLYGQLGEIIKEAEEQEEAYRNVCKLYLSHKPEVISNAFKTMSDIISGKNLKGE